ncbi:hypothetical protein P5673_008063 [Acropora cervicornis]|uniref:Uncharacterized protein n=1 Tax=Acropora cervicornis TaxID=6130 RepID=A0AAD9QV58_ACRCE|nr:hypothetical protein P5673_008063 [Acropora cervicornis]
MSSLIVALVILVFGSLCTSQIITPCPKECTCEKQFFPESQGVGARVNCSSRRQKKFPWPLPFATTTLQLSFHKFKSCTNKDYGDYTRWNYCDKGVAPEQQDCQTGWVAIQQDVLPEGITSRRKQDQENP